MVLSRSVGVSSQTYTSADLFVVGFSASIGVGVYDMYPIMQRYGGLGLVGFPFAGLLQLISVLSYSEITSKKPCIGGPYHYAYHFFSEMKAFLIGWILILCLLSGVSYRLKYISALIDSLFFDGTLQDIFNHYAPFPNTGEVLGDCPDVLAFIVAFTLAGLMSLSDKESKNYLLVCFIFCLTYLSVLLIINIGFVDFENATAFLHLSFNRMDSLLKAYLSCSQNYVYIYLITFLGEETVEPTKSVPASIIRLFFCSWAWNTVCPLFIMLNFRDTKVALPIQAFLERVDLVQIHWFVLLGVIAGSLCSVFMLMMCLERLIVAMSRDGLLFQFFVDVAHSSDTYVAPSFFIGLLSGLLAMVMHRETLRELFTVANMLSAFIGPIFVLRYRYTWSLDFLWEYSERTRQKQPNQRSQWLIILLTLSIFAAGCLSCYLLIPIKGFSDFLYLRIPLPYLAATGCTVLIGLVSLVTLFCSPTNTVKSDFKLWGVPFTPVLSMFLLALTAPLVKDTTYYTLATWSFFGLIIYFFYSINNSKEDF